MMFMQMCQLLGNPDDLGVVKGLPYDPEIVDFLDAVSEDIMKHPESRQVPGLNAFAFLSLWHETEKKKSA